MLRILCVIMTRMIRGRSKLSRRRRRSRSRRKLVDMDIIAGVGSEKGIDPEAGALGGRTAEIGEWIGM